MSLDFDCFIIRKVDLFYLPGIISVIISTQKLFNDLGSIVHGVLCL